MARTTPDADAAFELIVAVLRTLDPSVTRGLLTQTEAEFADRAAKAEGGSPSHALLISKAKMRVLRNVLPAPVAET